LAWLLTWGRLTIHQLLPRAYYDGLLSRHGFTDPGSASITPMHAITWARRPLG
jgi:hypothetical protein